MKAVILCGGEGSRLRPLTCDTPKPLVPLCGRPVICYLLDKLAAINIDEAILTVKYLSNRFTEWFDEHPETRFKLRFVTEEKPLGTAGSVGNCRDSLDDDFLVLSGDALFSFDLRDAVRFHREKQAWATLLTVRVDDPREYGCVVTDGNGAIRSFCEKPDWSGAVSDCANTGIYVLSPAVLSLIPPHRACDFASDVFMQMLKEGHPLYAKKETGYWCDIGGIAAYEQCQFDLLAGKAGVLPTGNEPPKGTYTVHPPVFFGKDVTVGDGVTLGPNVILGDGCRIGGGSSLRRSVLLDRVYVGNNCELRGALLCEGASVESTGRLFEGSVLGAKANVGVGASVAANVRVWPEKCAAQKTRVRENVKWGNASSVLFDDAGITGESGVEMTPARCARIGQAAATVFPGGRIAVCHDGQLPSRICCKAFEAGVTACGGEIIRLGEGWDTLLSATVHSLRLNAGFFFDSAGNRTTVHPCGGDGLPLSRSAERKLTSVLINDEFRRCGWEDYREPMALNGAWLYYRQTLLNGLPDLSHYGIRLTACDGQLQHFADGLTEEFSSRESALRFHVAQSGHTLSGFDENGVFLPVSRMEVLTGAAVLFSGEALAVPNEAPALLNSIAEQAKKPLLRFSPYAADEKEARSLAAAQRVTVDAFASLLRLLSYLAGASLRLCDFNARIPPLSVNEFEIKVEKNVQEVLRELTEHYHGEAADDGVRLRHGTADAFCRSNKRGDTLRVRVRASDMELAEEFTEELRKKAGE